MPRRAASTTGCGGRRAHGRSRIGFWSRRSRRFTAKADGPTAARACTPAWLSLWRSHSCRPGEGGGLPDRPQASGPVDARERHPGQDQTQVQGHHRQPSRSSGRAQPAGPAVHGRGAEHGLADLSYIWTREGWLYLAVVLDLFSRQVVGWAMDEQMPQELTLAALDMALQRRRPLPGLMHHSDRGSQYAAGAYQKRLAEHGIVCSMSRKGNCWDNAPMESFFHTLKTELVHHRDYLTRDEARRDIFEYIEVFYNRQRRHSTLGYLSPAQFEVTALAA